MELGIGELLVILVVALVFFGPSKLPRLGDALGRGIRNFKRASAGLDEPAAIDESAQASPGALPLPARAVLVDEPRDAGSPH